MQYQTCANDIIQADDAGIKFNVFQSFTSYPVPGPAVNKLAKRHPKDLEY